MGSGIQKQPFHIPFAIGLIDSQGRDLPLRLRGETASGSPATTRVLDFTEAEQTFVFEDVAEAPLPSLLRNFSAPVIVEYGYTTEQLTFQPVSYTHLTLPTIIPECRSRWSPYH